MGGGMCQAITPTWDSKRHKFYINRDGRGEENRVHSPFCTKCLQRFQIRPMLVEGFGKQCSLAFVISMSWLSLNNMFEPIARVRVGMPGKHGVRHISSCVLLPTLPKKTRLFSLSEAVDAALLTRATGRLRRKQLFFWPCNRQTEKQMQCQFFLTPTPA